MTTARDGKVVLLAREFLIDSTLVVAVFLIRAFEERRDAVVLEQDDAVLATVLNYNELDEFNDQWDNIYGEFRMGEYAYTASEILFYVDYKAYEAEHQAFQNAEPALETGEPS